MYMICKTTETLPRCVGPTVIQLLNSAKKNPGGGKSFENRVCDGNGRSKSPPGRNK